MTMYAGDDHLSADDDAFGPFDEDEGYCPACGQPISYCQGHGPIGDPVGARVLAQHDEGDHTNCHPSGCDEAEWFDPAAYIADLMGDDVSEWTV